MHTVGFALVAVAGELATKAGLTGWDVEEATSGVKACFDNWLEGFGGTGNKESSNIIAHVKGFIESHGASRFESVNSEGNERVINRVGFIRYKDDRMEYLIMPEAFKRELCSGYDVKTVTMALIESGILLTDNQGKPQVNAKVNGIQKRFYVLSDEKLNEV